MSDCFIRRSQRFWLVLLGVVLWTSAICPATAAEAQKPAKLFLWKATSNSTTVYLLGSVHAAKASLYPLAVPIEQAFADAEVLVVEADTDIAAQLKAQQFIAANGMYPPGQTVANHVDKATVDRLRQWCAQRKMPSRQFEQFKPWVSSITIAMMELQGLGYHPSNGIDQYFLAKARLQKKPIKELESTEFQLKLLSSFDAKTQGAMLAQTLADLNEMPEMFRKLMEAWKTGDAQAMALHAIEEPAKKHPELKPLMQAMFDDRNVKMTEKIVGYLKTPQPHLVVVGAGHLVGPNGIVELLKKQGYSVEQMTTASPVPLTTRPAAQPTKVGTH